jgi:hypothetical protein
MKSKLLHQSRDSVVGTATGSGLDDSPGRIKNFLFSNLSRPALGTPIERVPGALSLGVKRTGREADHSPPNSAEVTKIWIYTSTSNPPFDFMV